MASQYICYVSSRFYFSVYQPSAFCYVWYGFQFLTEILIPDFSFWQSDEA